MAQFPINIPDALVPRARDAICAAYQYQEQVENPNFDRNLPPGPGNQPLIPNPETKLAFARRMLPVYVRGLIQAHEIRQLGEGATAPKVAEIEGELAGISS
jgi:hypothetical protein